MKQQELRHFMLFTYSLSSKPQKDKVKILRELLGYREKKGKAEYRHEGMLQKNYSQKLGSNVLLVPAGFAMYFSNYFNQHKVPFEVREVWMK
ncbi:hypothetical protein HYV81_01340 [Candidatus Woesearchaeota archaeon]|nr:hypothetical protein [Candidatus Woesearchaeota archaeon]